MNFEEELEKELDKLPFEKHLDDGHYNDGQITGFELGARWAYISLINHLTKKFGDEWDKNGMGSGISYSRLISYFNDLTENVKI